MYVIKKLLELRTNDVVISVIQHRYSFSTAGLTYSFLHKTSTILSHHNPLKAKPANPIKLTAPPPIRTAGTLPIVPILTATRILPKSTASTTIPAQRALLISLFPLSSLSLFSAVISNSPSAASRIPKNRGQTDKLAGIGNWKSEQVNRGAIRADAPMTMRPIDMALTMVEVVGGRGFVCSWFWRDFGGRRWLV